MSSSRTFAARRRASSPTSSREAPISSRPREYAAARRPGPGKLTVPPDQAGSEIREQARELIEAAEANAAQIRRAATLEAAAIRREALRAGARIRERIELIDRHLDELGASLKQQTHSLGAELSRRGL